MGQAMLPEDYDASTADDVNLAMQLVLQLPHSARRSLDVISSLGRLGECKYAEQAMPPGVYFLHAVDDA